MRGQGFSGGTGRGAGFVCSGGAEGDRTPDLIIANDTLSQLSYCPAPQVMSPNGKALSRRGEAVPGLSHLAEDGFCDLVGPACAFAIARDGEFGAGFSEQVAGAFARDCQVFRAVVLAVPGVVRVEGHVEPPVQRVPGGPMGADGGGKALWGEAGGGQVVACCGHRRVADLAGALHAGEAGQAGKGVARPWCGGPRRASPPRDRPGGGGSRSGDDQCQLSDIPSTSAQDRQSILPPAPPSADGWPSAQKDNRRPAPG